MAFINMLIHLVLPAPLGPSVIIPWRTRWVSYNWMSFNIHGAWWTNSPELATWTRKAYSKEPVVFIHVTIWCKMWVCSVPEKTVMNVVAPDRIFTIAVSIHNMMLMLYND
jgi:hypothetical protein